MSEEIREGWVANGWTVIKEVEKIGGKRTYLCRCICGETRPVRGYYLFSGGSRSCGCVRKNPYPDLKTRFFQKVKKTDDCWVWEGGTSSGYGVIRPDGGEPQKAPRMSWEIHNGPIPDGLFVCHHCDNPSCVNPDHLFLGTNKDNQQDMLAKNRGNKNRGEKVALSKLTEKEVLEIRAAYVPRKVMQKDLAKKYGVDTSTIKCVIARTTWKHL